MIIVNMVEWLMNALLFPLKTLLVNIDFTSFTVLFFSVTIKAKQADVSAASKLF